MKKQFALALALATMSFGAAAAEPNYTYLEGGFARLNLDVGGVGDADFDGFQVRGSVEAGKDFHFFGSYGSTNNDDAGIDVDFDELQVGLGYHYPLSDSTDLLAEIGYIKQEIDVEAFGDADADGYRASVGFRSAFNDHFEGYVKGSYNGGDFDGFSGTVGAQVKFNQTWGLVGEIEAGEMDDELDATKYLIGVRASF